jgi:hypothetical protein
VQRVRYRFLVEGVRFRAQDVGVQSCFSAPFHQVRDAAAAAAAAAPVIYGEHHLAESQPTH